MSYTNIKVETENLVNTITINRADKMNALNISTLQEIKAAVIEAENNAEIAGIMLRGDGEKAFAAGADISEFANFNVQEAEKMSRDGHEVMNAIENCSKPVIAVVYGFALGGGCELAMACHIRIAAENAKFGQPEANLGVPPGYGGTQRLVQLVGKSKAMELLLTTDILRANEALDLGLVSAVLPVEEVLPYAKKMISKIASKSPSAVSMIIDSVNDYYKKGNGGMETEIKYFGKAFGTEDFKEGTEAFLEKRKADFKRS
jgi:enoyl-CoA hydratase